MRRETNDVRSFEKRRYWRMSGFTERPNLMPRHTPRDA